MYRFAVDAYREQGYDDRISLVGLRDLAPDKQIMCYVHHSDGTHETLQLNHSLNPTQIEWFRAGAAINLLHSDQ